MKRRILSLWFPRLAAERGAKGFGAMRLVRAGDEGGADGARIAEGHVAAEAEDLGRGREAGEDERPAPVGDDGEGPVGETWLGTQHPLRREAGKPEGEDAALHGKDIRERAATRDVLLTFSF